LVRLPWGKATLFLLSLVLLSGVLGVRFGSVELSNADLLQVLRGGGDPLTRFILLELRLPRVLLAMGVGGGLALAGATLQALLRNPLAEPYILGLSAGAVAGVVVLFALGWAAASAWILPGGAFLGAVTAIVLVFGVAASADRRLDVRVLLLAGVVVGAFFSACITLVLSLSDAPTTRTALAWMMGSLSGATWKTAAIVAAYTAPAVLGLIRLSRTLNLMAIGEETAHLLGAEVESAKKAAYLMASLLAAAGVAFTGVIGFVGLVVPHVVRMLCGTDHRILLPLSFLAGAAYLSLMDILARTVIAPTELPIGVVTALVGVPFFLFLLRQSLKS